MTRLDKIYTKVGDQGSTRLATGEKVGKTDLRIEAYGTVDELNAFVGLLADSLDAHDSLKDLGAQLRVVQNSLFDLGGELSIPSEALEKFKFQRIAAANITWLEEKIDTMNESLTPLQNFVLPGGRLENSYAQVCRTICRRAERRVFQLMGKTPVRQDCAIFLNRLSDYFFVLGRAISKRLNVSEVLWQQHGERFND